MSSYFGGSQRPMCSNATHCGGVHNPSHRAQFRHQCPYGKNCPQQYLTEHKAEFAHDLFTVEQRSTLPPVATAPQLVPGPAPMYQPLPFIAGMEGSGPDKQSYDPIRGNRGPDTYVMAEPVPQGDTTGAVVQGQPVSSSSPPPQDGKQGKQAAPVPTPAQPAQGFTVSAAPPQPVMLPGAPMAMASPYPPAGAFLPMPHPYMMPMQPQPGQPGFAQPPPQPPSPFPGYYLHQAGK